MRVIHVVPAISEEASGPSYTVPRLCESLIDLGVDVQLATLKLPTGREPLSFVRTFRLGLGPARLGVSPRMRRWLEQEVGSGEVDLVHNHDTTYISQCRERGAGLVVIADDRDEQVEDRRFAS